MSVFWASHAFEWATVDVSNHATRRECAPRAGVHRGNGHSPRQWGLGPRAAAAPPTGAKGWPLVPTARRGGAQRKAPPPPGRRACSSRTRRESSRPRPRRGWERRPVLRRGLQARRCKRHCGASAHRLCASPRTGHSAAPGAGAALGGGELKTCHANSAGVCGLTVVGAPGQATPAPTPTSTSAGPWRGQAQATRAPTSWPTAPVGEERTRPWAACRGC
jgi:hypothetical protein